MNECQSKDHESWAHSSSTSHPKALPFNFFPFPEGKSMHSQAEENIFCSVPAWHRLSEFEGHYLMILLRHWMNGRIWPSGRVRYSCTRKMKLLAFNPPQILLTAHSQGASQYISPCRGVLDSYCETWQKTATMKSLDKILCSALEGLC